MKDKSTILLDLDGTIVNSFESVKSAIVKTMGRLACTVPPELDDVKDVGSLLPVAKKYLTRAVTYNQFKQEYDKVLRADPLSGVSVPDGILQMLARLKEKHNLVVLTNKRQDVAESICHTLFPERTFLYVIGRTGTVPLKPNGPIAQQLKHRGISLSAVRLLIGDSEEDRMTALRLGVKFQRVGRNELE